MAARDRLSHVLPSGRVLGYAEYGAPNGYPLFYLHGYPSSRLEAGVASEIAKKRNVRIISPDRPGFGLSDSLPGRKLSDWPQDVSSLAKHLNLDRFAILGGSGGGPYAIACANAISKDTLSAVGVLAGAPHWAAGPHLMSRSSRMTAYMARRTPFLLNILLGMLVGSVKTLLSFSFVRGYLAIALDQRIKAKAASGKDASMHPVGSHAQESQHISSAVADPGADQCTKSTKPISGTSLSSSSVPVPTLKKDDKNKDPMLAFQSLCDALLEPFRQGVQATVDEAVLFSDSDWGFKLEDVSYDKIQFWHGAEDTRAPIEMMRWMIEKLPHAEMKEFEETGHFDMHPHLEEIIVTLAPEDRGV